MKDMVHHLKHIQKKVIQSVRKANAEEEKNNHKNGQATNLPFNSLNLETKFIPTKKRRKTLNKLRYAAQVS